MKSPSIRSIASCGSGLLLALLLAPPLSAAEPTAYELVEKGNEYVGKDAAGKVNQIRSERSTGTLVPSVWYIVYFDADASAKATEVKNPFAI